MSSAARKSVATKELLRQVASQSTGRLAIDTVDGPIELYLMSGNLIGAVHPLDDIALLRRVQLADALPPERLSALTRLAHAGQSVFGPLLDQVPTEMIEPALEDRFRDNLARWVGQTEEPTFQALPGVFVDNMQMGHDTLKAIDRACSVSDLAFSYPTDIDVTQGEGTPHGDLETFLYKTASAEPFPLEKLLQNLPGEPLANRAAAARLLDAGLLLESGVELQELHTDEVELIQQQEAAEDVDDLPTVVSNNALLDAEEESPEPVDETPDPLDEPEEPDPAPVSPGSSEELSKWLHTGDIDEADMAFFADHEDDRGAGEGGFSTESHNLDKVSIGESDDEIIEVDEAPAAKFAAPILSEDVAMQKIDVANDVLQKVAIAFDAASGAGKGQAAIQLLVDGSPSKYSAVLHDLAIGRDGAIPVHEVLDNLAGRPATEHRQLLNNALKDVIERALSIAADDLPMEVFDDLYEAIAGYNQRLGL